MLRLVAAAAVTVVLPGVLLRELLAPGEADLPRFLSESAALGLCHLYLAGLVAYVAGSIELVLAACMLESALAAFFTTRAGVELRLQDALLLAATCVAGVAYCLIPARRYGVILGLDPYVYMAELSHWSKGVFPTLIAITSVSKLLSALGVSPASFYLWLPALAYALALPPTYDIAREASGVEAAPLAAALLVSSSTWIFLSWGYLRQLLSLPLLLSLPAVLRLAARARPAARAPLYIMAGVALALSHEITLAIAQAYLAAIAAYSLLSGRWSEAKPPMLLLAASMLPAAAAALDSSLRSTLTGYVAQYAHGVGSICELSATMGAAVYWGIIQWSLGAIALLNLVRRRSGASRHLLMLSLASLVLALSGVDLAITAPRFTVTLGALLSIAAGCLLGDLSRRGAAAATASALAVSASMALGFYLMLTGVTPVYPASLLEAVDYARNLSSTPILYPDPLAPLAKAMLEPGCSPYSDVCALPDALGEGTAAVVLEERLERWMLARGVSKVVDAGVASVYMRCGG